MRLTKAQLIKNISENTELKTSIVERVLGSLADEVAGALAIDGEITLPGIAKLTTVNKPERKAHSPRTGEPITVAPKTVVKFKALKPLNDAVN